MGLLEFAVDVGMMNNAIGLIISQRNGQGILAHNTNRSEFDLHAGFAVVGVGEQQIFFTEVIARHPNVTGELGQNPDPFTVSQGPGGVIDGGVLTDNGIEEPEHVLVLQRRIVLAHHTQYRIGLADEVAGFPDDGELVRHGDVFGAGVEGKLDDRPIELSSLDCFLCRSGLIEFGAETVPGNFIDVEHGSLAVLNE